MDGAETISLYTTESTNKIVLHLHEILIDKKSLKLKNIKEDRNIRITDQFYDVEAQKYNIQLAESLIENEQYDLEVKFVGKVYNNNMQGLYNSIYTEKWNITK